MRYKALILDLDGTTVFNAVEAMPSEKVAKTIHKAKNKIHISVATGRPLFIAKKILDHLDLSGPCILNNGTQLYDPIKKTMIKETAHDKQAVNKIITIFKRYKVKFGIFDGNDDTDFDKDILPEKILSIYAPDVFPEQVDEIVSELNKIPHVIGQKIKSWNDGFVSIDVTHTDATKLHGIVEIKKLLHIKQEEIIGVGDSYNDFPLLMACGLKIAMGNAVPELKAIADFVAPSVEEDGVATVIEKFILNN